MYLNNIDDKDLCKIIYKASSILFPNYSNLFHDDMEEFQQQCCVLMLDNIKKYNSSKGSISTYIYNVLPLLINRWLLSKEGKTFIYNSNNIDIDKIISNKSYSISINYNINNNIFKKIFDEYKIVKWKLVDDLSFSQLAKKLNTSKSYARYQYAMQLANIYQKYENILARF